MTNKVLNDILENHGMYTKLNDNNVSVLDKNDKVIDTVELINTIDGMTIIKTNEYESIGLVEYLGY